MCSFGAGYDSNCYLVSGERPGPRWIPAHGAAHSELICSIASVAEVEKVRTIILTHRHYDHVGGVFRLAQELGAEVVMHELDAPPVREGSAEGTSADLFGSKVSPLPVRDVREGDVIDTGEHRLTILHTPGHTIGGMCLYEAETGILISGDTIFAGGVGRWDLPTGNRGELVRSIRRLAELTLTDLYPGHGPCAQGDAEQKIDEAIEYLGESRWRS